MSKSPKTSPKKHSGWDEDPVLGPGTLAGFLRPLKWREILDLDRSLPRAWWRAAIVHADGEHLLWWDTYERKWGLTPKGRKAIRDVN